MVISRGYAAKYIFYLPQKSNDHQIEGCLPFTRANQSVYALGKINGKQTSGLVNLPFAEISSLYLKKPQKPETGIKDPIFTYGTHISV